LSRGTSRPALTAIVCTRDRPVLLRRAVAAIRSQRFADPIETIVVFDRSDPDASLEVEGGCRPVRVASNQRTPGLAGARNTGVALAGADVVAFCDDDDVWLADKTARQMEALAARSEADAVVSGVRIETAGRRVDRALALPELTFGDLLVRRVMEAHPSTIMVRRRAFLDRIGGIDEHIPGCYAEDYEWLLRAARHRPIAVVAEPLSCIEWHENSYFAAQWQTRADALAYLLERYPEFRTTPRGLARIKGQRAFALAALRRRADAWREVRVTLALNWLEPRAYLAGFVATGAVSPNRVVGALNRLGRGV
jgi:glycosyltransferase involved in cell wall biosynthesis